ncbi:MAG: hypothetical protein GF331_20670 [Chitinivibrionales bacterium]|nr:hypothetical protein [Chitinivibrionales bacterium]
MHRATAVIIALLAAAAVADTYEESKNALYVELLGNAVVYSLNYDRVIATFADNHHVGVRIGFTLLPVDTLDTRYPMIFPVTANYLLGPREHKLELGVGVSPRMQLDRENNVSGKLSLAATLCYRYVGYENDFHFRIGFTPLFFTTFKPWFGLSLGRAF